MSHSYAQNIVHVVFSTKGRAKCIAPSAQGQLWAYITGICKNEGIFVHAIGGTTDHLHCLLQLPPTHNLAQSIGGIKANSSRWLRDTAREFAWQEGYAAFSVSASLVPAVRRYIQNQEAHHRKMSFDDEFRVLLRKHGVDFDPKFVLG